MALSLSLILLLGMVSNRLFEQLNLPGLLGMLLTGVLLGPYGFDLLSPDLLAVSGDLRLIALIIILLRAGLGLDRETLNRIGGPALRMSFLPGLAEGLVVILTASLLLGIGWKEAGILAFLLAAVSPAVVVPGMLDLIEKGASPGKKIPTLILAGASLDDVVAITLFTAFTALYSGTRVSVFLQVLQIPLSIGLGLLLGILSGLILVWLYRRFPMRATRQVMVLLGGAILLTSLEDALAGRLPLASLLSVMTVGFLLLEHSPGTAHGISSKLGKIWLFAQLLLFVLVGAAVNIQVALDSGLTGVIIIGAGLLGRSAGVLLSLIRTGFSRQEKLFCIIAYTPKATVQAAMGAVPLALGVPSGEIFLAIAVLSILITAPLGALGIRITGEPFLGTGPGEDKEAA